MIQEGDIVEIPLPDKRVAIGKILHISSYFKDAVGFIVFGIRDPNIAVSDFYFDYPEVGSMHVLGPIYTHKKAIDHYGWKKIAHQSISPMDVLLTKREVGGAIYVADNCIGSFEKEDLGKIKPMLAMGMAAVYKEIEKSFGK